MDRETDVIMDETIRRLATEIAIADYHGKHRIEINVELLRKTLGYLEELYDIKQGMSQEIY